MLIAGTDERRKSEFEVPSDRMVPRGGPNRRERFSKQAVRLKGESRASGESIEPPTCGFSVRQVNPFGYINQ